MGFWPSTTPLLDQRGIGRHLCSLPLDSLRSASQDRPGPKPWLAPTTKSRSCCGHGAATMPTRDRRPIVGSRIVSLDPVSPALEKRTPCIPASPGTAAPPSSGFPALPTSRSARGGRFSAVDQWPVWVSTEAQKRIDIRIPCGFGATIGERLRLAPGRCATWTDLCMRPSITAPIQAPRPPRTAPITKGPLVHVPVSAHPSIPMYAPGTAPTARPIRAPSHLESLMTILLTVASGKTLVASATWRPRVPSSSVSDEAVRSVTLPSTRLPSLSVRETTSPGLM